LNFGVIARYQRQQSDGEFDEGVVAIVDESPQIFFMNLEEEKYF
jgi:hypothetical protein